MSISSSKLEEALTTVTVRLEIPGSKLRSLASDDGIPLFLKLLVIPANR